MKLKSRLVVLLTGAATLVVSPYGAGAAQAAVSDRSAVVVVSETPATGLTPVQMSGPDSPRSYRIAAAVPAGGSLSPARAAESPGSFSGDVVVRDARGKVVGGYDAPYAIDANGRLLNGTYRIEGTNLVQSVVVDEATAYPISVLLSDFSPLAAPRPGGPSARVTLVTVPSNYVYNPSLGSLHDYCTSSPDSYFAANFRGPCARHDLCYEAPGDHKAACDSTFRTHLYNNCDYAYSSGNPVRATCRGVAQIYYAAVTAFGDDN